MTWQEATQIVIARQNNPRWEYLTSDACPEHVLRRDQVLKLAGHFTEKVAISTGNGGLTTIPASESIQINKEIKECLHHIKDSGCGCGRARCKIGRFGEIDTRTNDGTTLVSFWDCSHCLRPDVELYAQNIYKKLQ